MLQTAVRPNAESLGQQQCCEPALLAAAVCCGVLPWVQQAQHALMLTFPAGVMEQQQRAAFLLHRRLLLPPRLLLPHCWSSC